MSSFEVETAHIDALVNAALAAGRDFYWYHEPASAPHPERGAMMPDMAALRAFAVDNKREVTLANAGMWGAVLADANKRSVNYRYDSDEIEEPYEFTYHAGPFSPEAILRALDCYEYQSCDDSGWRASEAREFVEALRRHMIRQLPGYPAARWAVDDISQVLAARTVAS